MITRSLIEENDNNVIWMLDTQFPVCSWRHSQHSIYSARVTRLLAFRAYPNTVRDFSQAPSVRSTEAHTDGRSSPGDSSEHVGCEDQGRGSETRQQELSCCAQDIHAEQSQRGQCLYIIPELIIRIY